jgi:hypothetical protein
VKETKSFALDEPISSAATRPPPGFTAHLSGMCLTDLVRLQSSTEASGVFLVVSGERSGMLHFSAGRLFHAETREHRGDAAALEILSWTGGEFIRSERSPSGATSVQAPLDALISQALGLTPTVQGPRFASTSTGIRRRSDSGAVEWSSVDPRRDAADSSTAVALPMSKALGGTVDRDLRAAATPGVAAGPAPRRTNRVPEGRTVASALISPLGDLVEGSGPAAESLATRVAYMSRLCELIGQGLGSGEARSLRARYADSELSLQPHADGKVFGCVFVPDAH